MTKSIKSITNPKLKLEILTPAEVKKIHDATLWIIEKVGVKFPSNRALDIWAANGAEVDRERKIVKAKGELIESALKKCPPVYPLAARDPNQDLLLDGNHVFVGTDGCGVEVIDIQSGERRMSKLQDVGDIARIADATEEVAFHWVPVSAQDVPPQTRGLREIKAIWENSTKHVQTESIYTLHEAKAAIEMAAMIAGGKEALRKRPVLSLMQCTASPLGHDGGSHRRGFARGGSWNPHRLHDDVGLPHHRSRNDGWHAGSWQCGSDCRNSLITVGLSGSAGLLCRSSNRIRSSLGRIYRRRPRRFSVRRSDECAFRFL